MSHNFSTVPRADIPRSSFDRSHGYKTTFNAGDLIPFYCDEALPGDTFNLKTTAFARLATPLKPIMDNMFLETFYFSVPVRQCWENWIFFNGEQVNPGDSTEYEVPTLSTSGLNTEGSIYDYMGVPTDVSGVIINALHLRAYNHIYNNWFRDENLIGAVNRPTNNGPDDPSIYTILKRRKRPDYFTSCLPWPQKGEAVRVPLGDIAPVVPTNYGSSFPTFEDTDQTTLNLRTSNGDINVDYSTAPGGAPSGFALWAEDTGLQADLSDATGITINDLRQSFQIQKLLERDARGGTRYPEILKSHFGVTDPMMLVLQRPEFLGGGSTPVNIQAVEQNSETNPDGDPNVETPQGNLAAYGTASMTNNGFTKSFTEHCVIIGIVNVRADLTYQQGLNRMWSRQTRFDYYWPALSNIGEQAVLNKEIFTAGTELDNEVFGYQERYAEYRYKPSLITGAFRSNAAASLDVWHLSEEFDATPGLNQTFIDSPPPVERVIAVQDEPHFLFDAYIQLKCARPMPLYGIPGMIDHF